MFLSMMALSSPPSLPPRGTPSACGSPSSPASKSDSLPCSLLPSCSSPGYPPAAGPEPLPPAFPPPCPVALAAPRANKFWALDSDDSGSDSDPETPPPPRSASVVGLPPLLVAGRRRKFAPGGRGRQLALDAGSDGWRRVGPWAPARRSLGGGSFFSEPGGGRHGLTRLILLGGGALRFVAVQVPPFHVVGGAGANPRSGIGSCVGAPVRGPGPSGR